MKTHDDHTKLRGHEAIDEDIAISEMELISNAYEYSDTLKLVKLVNDAAASIQVQGESAFTDFHLSGSHWRQGEIYIFVLDAEGNMLVHADPGLEGKNQMDLKDINGKPIIRGLIEAATAIPQKPEGWYHYQWPVPGGLFPRWKSSYVQLVNAPSGKKYIVGSGMYNDRMERVFVVDMVKNAVGQIRNKGVAAFSLFRDPTGPYLAKDAYIFVTDMNGVELLNPAFPNLEGRKLLDLKDARGKYVNREMLRVIQTDGSGWVDYMWPKPGDSIPMQMSGYVQKAKLDDQWVMVGCGVYLADAPLDTKPSAKMSALELMALVHQAADILKEQGEKAYPAFRKKDSKWFHDDTYLFIFRLDGTRELHVAEPESEGRNDSELRDILGRPIVKWILETGSTPLGEGWIHYMYPEPGDIFPAWKSTFVKRVIFPSGKEYIVGSGIYKMKMNKTFIEDVVSRAAALVVEQGKDAFPMLRDKKGPFVFMDTYVFVQTPEGTELVNPVQPGLEGKNLIDLKDLKGKEVIRDEINAALMKGSAWMECYWYKPGSNTSARKLTYVRKVEHNRETYIIGSGLYIAERAEMN